MNITDAIRRHAQASPDAPAVIRLNGKAASYRDLDRRIDSVAVAVRALGFGPGALVSVRTGRPYRDLCVRLALARLGVGIAPRSMPMENVAACLTDGAIPDEHGAKFVPIDRVWSPSVPSTDVPEMASHQDGAALCALFPTSGTTGTPKFVAVSHAIIAHRFAAKAPGLRLPGDARQICTIGPEAGYGLLQRLDVLVNGGVVVTTTGVEHMLGCIDRHRVTHLAMAPFSLHRLAKALPPGSAPSPSLRQIEVVGSALAPGLSQLVRERLCSNVVSQYGSAESGPVAGAAAHSLEHHPGAVGYVYPGVEVQAVDADDMPLPPGTEGTLRVRSAGCVDAYFGDPATSALVFRGGWVYPGDVGTVGGDGLLTVTGRTSEVINQGGVKVNPRVIEDVLLSIPEIGEAAAFGVPDALGVTRIWAAIVPNGALDMGAVKALCRERLKANAPKSILRVKALPRNETGKILRDVLRKRVIARAAKRVGAARRSEPN